MNPVVGNVGPSTFGVIPTVKYTLNGTTIPLSACPDPSLCGVDFNTPTIGGLLDILIFSGPQLPIQVPPDQELFILFAVGPQLFAGPNSSPTLIPVDVALGACCKVNTSGQVGATGALTVAHISALSSVPEPSPLILLVAGLLMLSGIGLVFAMRKRRASGLQLAS